MSEIWIGIDVSKKSLDASVAFDGGVKRKACKVANSSAGFSKLVAWASSISKSDALLRFCMESTGDYGLECASSNPESAI